MSKTISGIVTWLRNWFYTKAEVDSLISTGGGTISIEDTDLFDVLDCINNNFDNFDNFDGYLFYDACDSSSGLANYGSSVVVRGTNASATIGYDSTENAYKISGTGNYFAGIPITPLKDLDNFKVTAEMKCGVNNWLCQIGFYTRDYTDTTKQAYSTHLFGDARYRWFYVTPTKDGSYQAINTSSAHYTSYTKMEWIVEGTSIKMNIYDSNDDVAYTITKDTVTYAKREFGFWIGTEKGTSYACYVRNIIAEPI